MLKTIKFIHDAEHFIVEGPFGEGTLEVWKMNDNVGSDGKLQGDTVCKFPLDGDHHHGAVTDIVETEDAIYVGIAEKGEHPAEIQVVKWDRPGGNYSVHAVVVLVPGAKGATG